MSETETPKFKRLGGGPLALILSVILLLAGGAYLFWRTEHPSFDRYSAALEAMRLHQVTVDGPHGGRVDLSKDFPGLTPENKALISWLDDGSFRAVFPTHLDGGAALSGLLYTSRPLTEDDTEPRSGSSIHFDQRIIEVGSYSGVVLDAKLNDHWYRVSYKIH